MCKITYLKLKSFRRFPLRDLDVFEHEFTSKLNIITGGNGSGKTSLINELSPLPADKNNFNKGGYKEIHVEKDKQFFKLISDFTDGAKYYFYLDEENLNQSNNITTQRDLVFKYFNITQTIHELLIGTETFTDMSLLNRKKLFNSITHLNIDKIIDNYNVLKEELKNNEFLLKTQMSLSLSEEQKLINKDHLNNLLTSQKQAKDYIDTLLSLRSELYKHKSSKTLNETYSSYKSILDKFNYILDKSYIYLTAHPNNNIPTYNSQIDVINFKLEDIYSKLEQKQQEIKILNLNKEHDLQSLKLQSIKLAGNKQKLISSLSILKNLDCNIEEIKTNIYKLEVSLPDVILALPVNDNKKYTKDKYDALLTSKKNMSLSLNEFAIKEAELVKELSHVNAHKKELTCPNCSHVWTLDGIDAKVASIKKELSAVLSKKLETQKTFKITEDSITEFTEYFNIYKQYCNLKNITYVYLKPFWDIVDNEQYIFHSPKTILTIMKMLLSDVMCLEDYNNISGQLNDLNKNIEILSTLKDTNISNYQLEILKLNEETEWLQTKKEELLTNIANNKIANDINISLYAVRNALEASKNDLCDVNLSHTIESILNVVDAELSKYKVVLIEAEKELNNYNNIKYSLDKYKKQIDDISINIKVLNMVINELSPKDGLIAKSVSSFLNIIISNVNKVITSVWDYKMTLKAINVENEALNYRFKVEIEDNLEINDINLCSKGMQKIINFSFMITLYKLLNLEDYMLFLDEFTTNLDDSHSRNFVTLVSNMSSSNKFSQIFIISHLANEFYFKDSDITRIDLT